MAELHIFYYWIALMVMGAVLSVIWACFDEVNSRSDPHSPR